ncbi:MAG: FAD-binding oxidoreductase [Candidatus Rokubacteria bacterium]|nr:FAD-binding oxidoreductase [Candidatus Rokubacteria bacterium]
MPAVEETRLAGFATAEAAGGFVAALLDTSVQCSRLELLSPAASTACGGAEAWSVAIAIGSVAEAVRAQMSVVDALVARGSGQTRPAPADVWSRYGAAMTAGDLGLRVGTLPSEVSRAAREAIATLGAAAAVGACATAGVLDVRASGVGVAEAEAAIRRLRASVAPTGGSVVIQAAPRALRERVDPWGPIEPGALALMTAVKRQFDPAGVLNPGRFVGGL